MYVNYIPPTNILEFPAELQEMILDHLDLKERIESVGLVCKTWKELSDHIDRREIKYPDIQIEPDAQIEDEMGPACVDPDGLSYINQQWDEFVKFIRAQKFSASKTARLLKRAREVFEVGANALYKQYSKDLFSVVHAPFYEWLHCFHRDAYNFCEMLLTSEEVAKQMGNANELKELFLTFGDSQSNPLIKAALLDYATCHGDPRFLEYMMNKNPALMQGINQQPVLRHLCARCRVSKNTALLKCFLEKLYHLEGIDKEEEKTILKMITATNKGKNNLYFVLNISNDEHPPISNKEIKQHIKALKKQTRNGEHHSRWTKITGCFKKVKDITFSHPLNK
jgi:hypothetical protein